MMDRLYDQIAVKVLCNGNFGSGCLVQSGSKEVTYVITAKHCLIGTEKEPQEVVVSGIKIRRFKDEETWIEYTVKDFKMHETADIAIIILEENLSLSPLYIYENIKYREKVTICGYPIQAQDNIKNPKEKIDGEVKSSSQQMIEFRTEDSLATFTSEEKTYICGFSGSGMFVELDGKLVLTGIFTEVKHKDVGYKNLVGEKLHHVDEILKENSLPPLPKVIRSYIAKKYCGYLYLNEWERQKRLNTSPWIEFEHSKQIITDVKNHFFNNDEINVLHILGRSGIGKTRTVLKACQEEVELHSVIYFSNYSELKHEFIDYIKNETNELVRLVIDDISLHEWQDLNRIFSEHTDRIRIITIGVVPENKIQVIEGILVVPPPSNSDVVNLMKVMDSSLEEEEQNYLMSLCESDLRLVLLLINVNKRGKIENLPSINSIFTRFENISEILVRVFKQFQGEFGDFEDFKKNYIYLCLFIDIGFKNQFREELEYIAEYFNINISELDKTIEIAKNCWLGLIKSEFFEASPRALARLVFENDGWPLLKNDLENFIGNMPSAIMQKRFINRIEESGFHIRKEGIEALATWFRIAFPNSDLSLILNKDKSKIFKVYTEFSPENGLRWLESAINNISHEELLEFSSIGSKSRRDIVWLCEDLACFKDNFFYCEAILFKLAQCETENHISNNSKGVWQALFTPILSNTEVPFNERYKLLIKRLQEGTSENIELIIEAVRGIFQDGISRIMPKQVIGGRIVPKEWRPDSYQELIRIRKEAISLLLDTIELGGVLRTKLIDFIINELDIFVEYGFIERLKEIFMENELSESQILGIRKFVNNCIHRDLYPQYIIELMEWRVLFTNANAFEQKILDIICEDYWAQYHNNQQIDNDILAVAEEIVERKVKVEQLERLLRSNVNNTSVVKLFNSIGRADEKQFYKYYIEELITLGEHTEYVVAYLQGIVTRLGEIPKEFVDLLDNYTSINLLSALNITLSIDISKEGYTRIIEILGMQIENISQYLFKLQFTEWNKLMTEEHKINLFDLIVNSVSDKGSSQLVLRLTNMWSHNAVDKDISHERFQLILKVLEKCLMEEVLFDDWDWKEAIAIVPEYFIEEKIKLLIHALVVWKSGHGVLEGYALEMIKGIPSGFSSILMEKISEKIVDKKYRDAFFIHVYRGLFEALDIEVVKKWAGENEIDNIRALARHIKSPKPKENDSTFIPPLTEWLLEKYENDDRFFREFISGRHSFEVYSVQEKIEKHDELEKKMQPYLKHRLKRVREWAEYEVKASKGIGIDNQIMEARLERE